MKLGIDQQQCAASLSQRDGVVWQHFVKTKILEPGTLRMTYNFDPDRWYETERSFLDHRFALGQISEKELDDSLDALWKRYEDMLDRLDGTYRICDR